jgi:hypothetical protein
VFQRATATTVRGFTRRWEKLETTGSGSASSSLPFLAGVDSHCHLRNKTKRNNRQILFCSIFRSVFSGQFSSTLDL